jgi:hypothetical protein
VPYEILNGIDLKKGVTSGKEFAIRKFKLPIKEKL